MIPIKDDIPASTFPVLTVAIIAINIIIFAYEVALGPEVNDFILKAAAIPREVVSLSDIYPASFVPPPFTLLTAIFVHGGLAHIIGNMLFLWIFGDNVEDTFGHFGFLAFYLATGVAASLAHIVAEPSSTMPMIGASGAIAGVLGAYFILFPRANVKTLVFFFFMISTANVPAVIFLGLWFLFQILSSGGGGGVAWYAHIGGFAAGAFLTLLLKPALRRGRYR